MSNNNLRIGNDLVNLTVARTVDKHLDSRFLNRIFTTTEKQLILANPEPSKILWALWAAKEACFKACQKIHLDLFFSPQKIILKFLKDPNDVSYCKKYSTSIKGIATYKDLSLSIKWLFDKNTIHAIAILLDKNYSIIFDNWKMIKYSIFNIDSTSYRSESLTTRIAAKKFLMRSYKLITEIEIIREIFTLNGTKRSKPPILIAKDQLGLSHKLKNIDISLSHDHGWGAIACYENKTLNSYNSVNSNMGL